MPELPEIETVKLQLGKVLPGLVCKNVEIRNAKTVHGNLKAIEGRKVLEVRRRAKALIIDFEEVTIAFHFKMSGQLIFIPQTSPQTSPPAPLLRNERGDGIAERIVGGHPTEDFVGNMPSSHTRVIFDFTQNTSPSVPLLQKEREGGILYFNDQRMFGWIKVGTREQIENESFFLKLGPEPFETNAEEFIKRLGKAKRPIKIAIMDQEIISGVGNIYANDALWEAKINPAAPVNSLTVEQLNLLFEKIILVLSEGIKYGGATAADAKYIDLHGLGGKYQEHFRTYDQTGKPCKRPACRQAGAVIQKIVMGGRGTYYCLECQK